MFKIIKKLIIKKRINRRINKLIKLMKSEKNVVDNSFGDWNKTELYLFKAKCTMKALRRFNIKLSNLIINKL
jgi:hypothetical protein